MDPKLYGIQLEGQAQWSKAHKGEVKSIQGKASQPNERSPPRV